MTALPEGYLLRHATVGDLPEAQHILDAAESADSGEPRHHDTDLAVDSRNPRFDLERNAWVVAAADGCLAAVGWVWPFRESGEVTADLYVHPDHRGRGLSDVLLDTVEARAAEIVAARPPRETPCLVMWCQDIKHARLASLARRGFTKTRETFEMRIDFDGAPGVAAWPEGIVVRPLCVGHDERLVYKADEEAFAEHHLFEPSPYDEFALRSFERADYDPTLWLIAWDGEQVAGYVCAQEADDGGLVEGLAVLKPWRRRGLGLALLLEEFRLLHERGNSVVRLFVDAQNVTPAVRVYEKAGMRVERRFDVFEKALGASGK